MNVVNHLKGMTFLHQAHHTVFVSFLISSLSIIYHCSLTVQKDGPNKGRGFFVCAKPMQSKCDFFQWADSEEPSGGRGGGGRGRGGGSRGSSSSSRGATSGKPQRNRN